MMHGEAIVCFAPDLWGDIWRNRHRLLSVFARTNRIVYVEPRTTVRSLWRRVRSGTFDRKALGAPRVEEVQRNLFVYHDPVLLPRTRKALVGPAIDRARDRSLQAALQKLGISRPILWLVRPDCWDVPGKLHEKALLYQIVDDYLSYPGVTENGRRRLDREERAIASRADLVIVTSEHLLQLKRGLSSNVVLVRNGVDEHTLEEGEKTDGPIPAALAAATRPIYGYVGGITEKLDLGLLESLARRLDGGRLGTLALVGPTNVSGESAVTVARLRSNPGVVFPGPVHAADVPSYIRAFDVALIPYRVGDQSRAIDPLKLYEYLAFGKPTVCADISSVDSFRRLLYVASGPDDFARQLDEAARERAPHLVAERRAAAHDNSWVRRAEQISAQLEGLLAKKCGSESSG